MGRINFSRYMLIPKSTADKAALIEKTGVKSIFPLDCYLGISGLPFKITPAAMLKIAFWAQNQLSYQRAEEAIQEAMGISLNDDTIRLVANYVGSTVFHYDSIRTAKAIECLDAGKITAPRNLKGVLYIQTDGAALNTRMKNEDGSSWRENKLGEVFSSNHIRYWTDKKGNRQHQLLRKEYVSYVGSVTEFKKHLFSCALRNGYGKFQETVILSDGATWIRNMVEEMFPDAQQILDFFHLSENVHTYAKHIFPFDDNNAKAWAKNACDQLKAGKHKEIIDMLRSTKNSLSESAPVNLIGYITNNRRNIDYPNYIKKGYFIGSGAIESGNKIVLQDRLKRAGMRWNVDSAQAMLTLKSKAESNLWYEDVEKPFLEHCKKLSL
jgi:hypothetical protein